MGEGLQARPVAQALRDSHPEWQQAYTFFSPSAANFAASVRADITEYLPFDSNANADAMLDALAPSLLVFAKLDVWPVLVASATARGVPVMLVSGTLAESSGRLSWWSQQLVRDAYASLTAVGAIDSDHAERLIRLGVTRDRMHITGDTRFDQVATRAATVDRAGALLTSLASTRPTVVAGSTWPADEAVLLRAWESIAHAPTSPRLLIAPHEPTAAHCAPIAAWAARANLRLQRLSDVERAGVSDADIVLVDRVGVLGDLYALADVAFVGGGFHQAGLHSVIEPAAFGTPVVFGPQHHKSREAELLLYEGGAATVSNASALATIISQWLSDRAARQLAANRAAAVVERERGATARSVALIERTLLAGKRRTHRV